MELSLERCKAAPLQLRLDMSRVGRIPQFSDLLIPYIQNTETLCLSRVSTAEVLLQTLPNFPQSMPNLRSLSLWSGGPRWDRSVNLLGSSTPALTHLSLSNIPIHPSFLRLRTLTNLRLHDYQFNLHCDTLLRFLEENHSLEHVVLEIQFTHLSFRTSQRQVAIGNRLRTLSITSINARDNIPLISNILLQRGAHLEIALYGRNTELNEVLSVISTTHFSNLKSPTFMEYHPDRRRIRLSGPNGSSSYSHSLGSRTPFVEFPLLPLTSIREFRLIRRREESSTNPVIFTPSSLPALETLAIEHELTALHLLSDLFSNPSSSPSLNTLAFLDCRIDEGFMEALTHFASNRKNTTSASLYRVVIVNSKGDLPSFASIDTLGKHVLAVNVQIGKTLPTDLICSDGWRVGR